ncbi:class C beta-lactamase-related serine hydrolase [Paraflavitalea soli]|uniref:Class C beta-lactamase-related serine hydrolase n=1 Tax=Paraflavitalea soli TaxID=2315862 RepID=A0A3B7MKT6_9BACT|nr:serine hydrolase [Paraflavitalea soli]AXY75074.1 class C beta-lactamase-related serine hydrolase [Paraflavitalea soli]
MKKVARYFLYTILLIVAVFSIYAVASGRTYLFKAVWYNFADIDDYKKFTNNTVTTNVHQPWDTARAYNINMPDSLGQMMQELKTVAVLVIKNDSLLFERYDEGYNDSSWSGSFSVAKSITSLLIGAAIKEGKIHSVQDPVGNYLPEFATGPKAAVRIIDLLTMSSGSDWDESYSNPLSVTTQAYYGSDIYATATGVNIVHAPGTLHSYKSGDTQLLGLVVEKATGKSLSAYAAEKLWHPLGAEHPALWSTDHTGGHEKAYCCFNSNARDFARLGQLMLDSGRWKGNEIITPDYYQASIKPCLINDESGHPCDYYGYQWWIVPNQPDIFYARGILGQYIIVIPQKKLVVVRLGKKRSSVRINGAPAEVNALIQWAQTF